MALMEKRRCALSFDDTKSIVALQKLHAMVQLFVMLQRNASGWFICDTLRHCKQNRIQRKVFFSFFDWEQWLWNAMLLKRRLSRRNRFSSSCVAGFSVQTYFCPENCWTSWKHPNVGVPPSPVHLMVGVRRTSLVGSGESRKTKAIPAKPNLGFISQTLLAQC